jgi:hypothetical protein
MFIPDPGVKKHRIRNTACELLALVLFRQKLKIISNFVWLGGMSLQMGLQIEKGGSGFAKNQCGPAQL